MGVAVLVGKQSNNLRGDLTVLSGDIHARDENLLVSPLAIATGEWTGDQNNLADLAGDLVTLEGTFEGYSSANIIEGELTVLDLEGFITTSNYIAIEDVLPGIEGTFYGGGTVEGELSVLAGELTGTVPTVGNIDHTSIILEGSMSCGAEINFAFSPILLTGDMSVTVPVIGSINEESKLSILTGSFDAIVPFGADLIGNLSILAGTITAHTDTSAQIQGYLTTLIGDFHTQTEVSGSLAGDTITLSGYMHAQYSVNGDIEGDLSGLISTLGLTGDEPYDYTILRFVRGETR